MKQLHWERCGVWHALMPVSSSEQLRIRYALKMSAQLQPSDQL